MREFNGFRCGKNGSMYFSYILPSITAIELHVHDKYCSMGMKILAGIHDVTQCVSSVCQVLTANKVISHPKSSHAKQPSDITVVK